MTTDIKRGAEAQDDRDLQDDAPTPSHQGSSGGGVAEEVASRDELRSALGGDPEPTRVSGADKIQPRDRPRPDDGDG